METMKSQQPSASPQSRQKDVDLAPLQQPGGSRVLKEKPTSAIGVTGKVRKVEEEEEKVRKVETPPKRPTLQNADGGRTAPTSVTSAGEKLKAEEKQKFTRSQNNGGRRDLGKSENLRQQDSAQNGISKTPIENIKTPIEQPKLEPTRATQQITAKEKAETKTAPWRQGRSTQGEEKSTKGSKRQEQEAKVQEFLRNPNAPPGSSVPLEVRLRKPGEDRDRCCVGKRMKRHGMGGWGGEDHTCF